MVVSLYAMHRILCAWFRVHQHITEVVRSSICNKRALENVTELWVRAKDRASCVDGAIQRWEKAFPRALRPGGSVVLSFVDDHERLTKGLSWV